MPLKNKYIPVAIFILASISVPMVWLWWKFPLFFEAFHSAIPATRQNATTILDHYRGGDHVQVFYIGWKLKQAILQGLNIFTDPYNFASNISLYWDFHVGIQFLAIAFAMFLWNEIAAYNIAMIIFPMIATIGTAGFMARSVTKSWILSFAAGCLISFLPYRFVQLIGGHSGGFVLILVPLFIGAILRHRAATNVFFRWDALAGITLFLAVLSDEHQGYYLCILSAIVFPVWCAKDFFAVPQHGGKIFFNFLNRWRYLIAGLVASIAYGKILTALLHTEQAGQVNAARSFQEIKFYSRPLTKFFDASSYLNIGELLGWGSLIVCILLLGILLITRGWKNLFYKDVFAFGLAIPICGALMLGIGSHWSQKTGVYQTLYKYLPFFDMQRVPQKISPMVACLLVVVLLAVFETLRHRLHPLAKIASLICVLIIAIQPLRFMGIANPRPPIQGLLLTNMVADPEKIMAYMKQFQNLSDINLYLPAGKGGSRIDTNSEFFAYRSGRRFAGGYNTSPPHYFKDAAIDLLSFNQGKPNPAALDYARIHGITHLLLDVKASHFYLKQNAKIALDRNSQFALVAADENFYLYKLTLH